MTQGSTKYLRHSFAFRLVLIYLGIFMLSIALITATLFWFVIVSPLNTIKSQIDHEIGQLATSYMVDGEAALKKNLEKRAGTKNHSIGTAFHVFINPAGDVITTNLQSWPSKKQSGFYTIEADTYHEGQEIDYDSLSKERLFPNGARLIIGRDAEDIFDRREILLEALAWIAFAAILLGSIGGTLMSRAVNQRLENINNTARKVIAGNLSDRIETRGTGDDFDQLAETLNLMLSKIEISIASISRVSDSIAHELRMPLTRMRADLEDVYQITADNPKAGPVIEQAITEAERLKSVFEALLRIARLETGRHEITKKTFDLTVVMRDAIELYQPLADDKNLAISFQHAEQAMVHGDPDLLFQAASNILDNAVKYARPNTCVTITLATDAGRAVLCIENDSPTIPIHDLGRVTERFYRAAETSELEGLGLGLSLVKAVATAHNGHVNITNLPDGSGVAVELIVPAAPASILT
ncbi:sensor histidine kinase [Kordiimonas pumila]|uniref:histidine kinase n=1 Tax=Kordiimonas pumila TaxID=2161677 RepID=A0ABV7D601_9PROT|nr:ATP-binding protein [Kordiimonas pumila]